jgi:hypothetical protein
LQNQKEIELMIKTGGAEVSPEKSIKVFELPQKTDEQDSVLKDSIEKANEKPKKKVTLRESKVNVETNNASKTRSDIPDLDDPNLNLIEHWLKSYWKQNFERERVKKSILKTDNAMKKFVHHLLWTGEGF